MFAFASYIININFESDHLEDVGVKGYDANITKVTPSTQPPGFEIDVSDDK